MILDQGYPDRRYSLAAALGLVIIAMPLNLGAGVVYVAIAVLGFGAAGGMLQTGVTLRQMMCPGPRGRNVGMYYTFMGFASVFLPFIVGAMTGATGETDAVLDHDDSPSRGLHHLAVRMALYIIAQYKKRFGYSAMKPMKD